MAENNSTKRVLSKDKYKVSSTTNTISIKWAKLEDEGFKREYEIKYREAHVNGRQNREISQKAEIVLYDLRSNTEYEVIIYYTNEKGETLRMFEPFQVKTKQKKNFLELQDKIVCDNTKSPAIYALKVHKCTKYGVQLKGRTEKICVRDLEMVSSYFSMSTTGKREKSILLLGETGSGKSTLLNSLMNYIFEVSFDDDYRFSLINKTKDEQEIASSQHQSQTLGMTCYRVPYLEGLAIDFPLNLIDTPGFYDTRGKHFEDAITDQIEMLFNEIIQQIDAICIVVPLASNRLNKSTQETYDRIFKMFGKDIEKNIFVLITKDDGGALDACLDVLKKAEVPYQKHFRFCNADLFVKGNQKNGQTAKKQSWNNRIKTFRKLFETIAVVEPKSVKTSEAVIKDRRELQEQLDNMMSHLSNHVKIMTTLQESKDNMERNKTQILKNQDYKHKDVVPINVLKYTGERSFICFDCEMNCHEKCLCYNILMFTYWCKVMKWNAKCTKCKCGLLRHQVLEFKYTVERKEREFEINEIKTVHDYFVERVSVYEKQLAKKTTELKEAENKLDTLINHVCEIIKKINENALRKEFGSIIDCIDHLTERVNADSSNEYKEEEIKFLKEIRKKQEQLAKTQTKDMMTNNSKTVVAM